MNDVNDQYDDYSPSAEMEDKLYISDMLMCVYVKEMC